MEIKLQRLTLTNFKGVQEFEFEPEGQNATISGPNGAGKSTVADALSWLLFDKNQAGDKAFSVKTLDDAGQEMHNLEHEVEAVLRIEHGVDGIDYTSQRVSLRKVMTEKWTKKRGSQNPEFSGHETTYSIDLVPKPKKDFDAFVSGLVREDIFRMLTSITHFNQQKWQDRRRILLEVAGDVTDAAVIEANGDTFAELPAIMESRNFEDTVKMLKAQRPKINDELDKIPARIDEAKRSMPGDAACMPPQGTCYADLTAKLANLQNGRAAVLAGDTSEVREQIAAKRAAIDRVALEHRKAVMDVDEQRRKLKADALSLQQSIERIDDACVKLNRERSELEQMNGKLKSEYQQRYAELPPETICHTCGQVLPEGKSIEVLAKFNSDRAGRLGAIQKVGIANKARIEVINETIAQNNAEQDALKAKKEEIEAQVLTIGDPEGPNVTGLQTELAALTLKLSAVGTPDTAKFDAEIELVKAAILRHDEASANCKIAGQIEARVAELKADQKRLGAEIDELDRKIILCEAFTRAKVSMLEGSVAAKFSPLGFKLFSEQINGGLAECCETLIPSSEGAMVPWSDANTGGKIRAGLKIIEVLGHHYGISAPAFIDNAESITGDIGDLTFQTIKLVATDEHDGLTVEIELAEEVGGAA